jgi:hypothetical protein
MDGEEIGRADLMIWWWIWWGERGEEEEPPAFKVGSNLQQR